MNCSGNKAYKCGGAWANTVYATGSAGGTVGCWRDTAKRDLNGPAKTGWGQNTPNNCVKFCKGKGFSYAGLQYSNQCFCGNRYGTYGKATNCNKNCSGNKDYICGGTWANSVYYTGIRVRTPSHLGCFRDKGARDLRGPYKSWGENYVGTCVTFCKGRGYKYCGLQYSTWCFCGNRYGTYGRANNCNMKCSGNKGQTCGGTWANDVYSTGASSTTVGCWRDNAKRDLNGPAKTGWGQNTPQNCVNFCKARGFKYAGAQYSNQCFCANKYGKYVKAGNCNMKCSGDKNAICGGTWANSVYDTGRNVATPPFLGCFKDKGARDLNGPYINWVDNTVPSCVNWCKGRGYKYAGMQYSSWCFCGNRYGTYGKATNCNMKCRANQGAICGGTWANSVYSTGVAPITVGCWRDAGARDLNGVAKTGWNQNTPQNCANFCKGRGFRYAGVQYSNQCFCGNRYGTKGKAANCNMKCKGNPNYICGGSWANNVYDTGRRSRQPPALGCYRDKGARDLNGPYKSGWNINTPWSCVNFCRGKGYKFAGVQYSSQCFCGNRYGTYGKAYNCNMKCTGNKGKTCGGTWANNVYSTGK